MKYTEYVKKTILVIAVATLLGCSVDVYFNKSLSVTFVTTSCMCLWWCKLRKKVLMVMDTVTLLGVVISAICFSIYSIDIYLNMGKLGKILNMYSVVESCPQLLILSDFNIVKDNLKLTLPVSYISILVSFISMCVVVRVLFIELVVEIVTKSGCINLLD